MNYIGSGLFQHMYRGCRVDMRGSDAIIDCLQLIALFNLADIPSPLTYPTPQHVCRPLGKIVLGILCTYNLFSDRFVYGFRSGAKLFVGIF